MAKQTLLVKDVGTKLSVYTELPTGVVAPKLYQKVDASTIMPLFTGKFAYAATQLKSNGKVFFGRKATVKQQIREAIKGQPVKAATPGTEVNQQATSPTEKKQPRFVKGSPEAKAYMASLRAKRSNGSKDQPKAVESNTELVISESAATQQQSIANLTEGQLKIVENLRSMGETTEAMRLLVKWS
jgi:hypothetical protein